jgi:hypothetical protein
MDEYHRRFANTAGAKLLRAFFAAQADGDGSWTQVGLSTVLGVHKNTVHFWTIGFRRPHSHDLRLALLRIAGIPTEAWMTRDEKVKAKRLRAA